MYQPDSPASPPKNLPTMYDLPSENPEEPGLPDTFHIYQPRLLDDTFCPPDYPIERIFTGSDVNLYYNPEQTLWYKRPDWYAVLDVPRLYAERDLRLSYVVWDEKVSPFIVIELLSPGTEKEDLGRTLRDAKAPPTKWEVYEQILKIPYYAIFDRYSQKFQAFKLEEGSYRAIEMGESERFWLPEIKLGLGVWQGEYDGIEHRWLRWYDGEGWVLTPVERERQRAEHERQRAENERQRADRLIARLRALGIDPEGEE
ncbi:Uma2 family endonuclease [Oscillatoria sp. FACHB-1406]|uniref:Uma2 family endonuclease n=1 Tax=Oscillatoria sp. FACHB-1406 TaxID=2692846 RepID=UPI001686439C|nr:Uma2 family endonuclease [Oscillatoria sp. FACHB-1406]MBD2580435.1 Uma2 family endonuclease [Oscillatoria sp. FACHB-1406]